jgi:hypothetical protein
VARLAETLAVDTESLAALAAVSKRKRINPKKRVRVDERTYPEQTLKDGNVIDVRPGRKKQAATSLAALKPIKKGEVRNPYGRRGKSGCEGFTMKGLLKRTLERLTDQARESLLLGLIAKARVGDVQAIRLITELNDELLGTAAVLKDAVDEGVRISVSVPKKTDLPRTAADSAPEPTDPTEPTEPTEPAETVVDVDSVVGAQEDEEQPPVAEDISPNFCGAPRKR